MEQGKVERLLKKIVDDPQTISGIHNYCDRWCERCTHTAHCSVYRMEQAMGSNEDLEEENQNKDDFNKKFWEDIEVMFKVAAKMLHDMMKEMDIDPNDLPDEPIERPDPKKEKAVALSRKYTKDVGHWLKANGDEIKKVHDLYTNIGEEKALEIADAIEIIQYYFMLISTKTYRCHLPIRDDYMDDALGSAKIAIIVIDRSIASWLKLMEYFPQWEDKILGFLKQLASVKGLILKYLPNAMEFKRPGFDD
jgi:hypothetical protein